MKKLFTTLGVLGLITGASFAQKNVDLIILESNYQNGATYPNINNGDTVWIQARITNQGPDNLTISDKDSITFLFSGNLIGWEENGTMIGSVDLNAGDTIWFGGYGFQGDQVNVPTNTTLDTIAFAVYSRDASLALNNDPGITLDEEGNGSIEAGSNNLFFNTNITFGSPGSGGGGGGGSSINDINDKHTLSVFPNPAQNVIHVQQEFLNVNDVMMMISDITGRVVLQHQYTQVVGLQNFQLDISALANGAYTIKLVTGDSQSSMKFSVQR